MFTQIRTEGSHSSVRTATMETLEATAGKLHEMADSMIAQSAGMKKAVIKDKVDEIVTFYNDKIKSYMELLDSDKEVIDELHEKVRVLEEQAAKGSDSGNMNELLQQEKRNRLQTEEQSISITTQQEETINRLEAKLKQQEDIIQQYQQKLKEAGIPFHCQPSVKHLALTPRARSGTLNSTTGLDGNFNLTRTSSVRESSLLSQTAPTTPLLSTMDRTFGSFQNSASAVATPRTSSGSGLQESGLPSVSALQNSNYTRSADFTSRSTSADCSEQSSSLANIQQVMDGGTPSLSRTFTPNTLQSRGESIDRSVSSMGYKHGAQTFDSNPAMSNSFKAHQSMMSSLPQSAETPSLGLGGAVGNSAGENSLNASARSFRPHSDGGLATPVNGQPGFAVPSIAGNSSLSASYPSVDAPGQSAISQLRQSTPRGQAMQAQILADPVSSFMKEIQQLRVNSAMNTPRAGEVPSAGAAATYQRAATPRGMVNFNSVVPQQSQQPATSNKDAVSSFLEDVRTSLDSLNDTNKAATPVSSTTNFRSLIGDNNIRGIAAQAAPTRASFDAFGSAKDFAIRRN